MREQELYDPYKMGQSYTQSSKQNQHGTLVAAGLSLVLVIISGVFVGKKLTSSEERYSVDASEVQTAPEPVTKQTERPSKLSVLTTEDSTENPLEPRVEGAAAIATASAADSTFTAIADNCRTGTLFSLGEIESNESEHPADEFSWVGALDVVPDYSNPFVVGSSDPGAFPWRTSTDSPDTLRTELIFTYDGPPAQATLTLRWSPGKQGQAQKAIYLNTLKVGKTPLHEGIIAPASWENMTFYTDAVPLTLESGEHTLVLKHLSPNDTAGVWDYIEMTIEGC